MKRIMLLCSAGMSTSLLVTKMKQAAAESGTECTIWASAEAEAKERLDEVDAVLLAPQVRFLRDQVEQAIGDRPVKLGVIDPIHYGRLNGRAVLDQALALLD